MLLGGTGINNADERADFDTCPEVENIAPTGRMRMNRINCIFKQCVYDLINQILNRNKKSRMKETIQYMRHRIIVSFVTGSFSR
jgi:hypothetical protein